MRGGRNQKTERAELNVTVTFSNLDPRQKGASAFDNHLGNFDAARRAQKSDGSLSTLVHSLFRSLDVTKLARSKKIFQDVWRLAHNLTKSVCRCQSTYEIQNGEHSSDNSFRIIEILSLNMDEPSETKCWRPGCRSSHASGITNVNKGKQTNMEHEWNCALLAAQIPTA